MTLRSIVRKARLILTLSFITLLIAALAWLAQMPAREALPQKSSEPASQPTLKLAMAPEGDIYLQHKAYQMMAAYLSQKLNANVTVVTNSTYQGVLDDFRDQQIDFAFLGSLVAALAIDRYQAHVLLKPEYQGGISTYAGIIFVPDSSPIHSLADLANHSLGGVRTTTAGALFPVFLLHNNPLLTDKNAPNMVWVGTHDDVIREVIAGRLDAGAVKNRRLDAYLLRHPDVKIRQLARSTDVPENAFLVRNGLPPALENRLRSILLAMHNDPDGQAVLASRNVTHFIPCGIQDYNGLFDMVEAITPQWSQVGIEGPPPHRPHIAPSSRATTAKEGT
jgi:phosphonate transport system substrate-binding protein